MEFLKIKPGSILLWKKYSMLSRLFSKLFNVNRSYNKFFLSKRSMELYFPITKGKLNYEELIILEPKEDYTKEEINLLNSLIAFDNDSYVDTLKIFANTVRSRSIKIDSDLDDLLWNENYKIKYDFSKKK